MGEYLKKRVVYAGDVLIELMKAGWTPKDAARLIEGVPDADVAPVVHGTWIGQIRFVPTMTGMGIRPIWFCTECGRKVTRKEPYCHCGAKMDGGMEDV